MGFFGEGLKSSGNDKLEARSILLDRGCQNLLAYRILKLDLICIYTNSCVYCLARYVRAYMFGLLEWSEDVDLFVQRQMLEGNSQSKLVASSLVLGRDVAGSDNPIWAFRQPKS